MEPMITESVAYKHLLKANEIIMDKLMERTIDDNVTDKGRQLILETYDSIHEIRKNYFETSWKQRRYGVA